MIKGLSTALGESTSDHLVKAINPVLAVAIGFVAFVLALALQLTRGRYLAWAHWPDFHRYRVEGTQSVHTIDTWRRESFSWAAVMATAYRASAPHIP